MYNSFLEFMQECMGKRIEDLRMLIAEDEFFYTQGFMDAIVMATILLGRA